MESLRSLDEAQSAYDTQSMLLEVKIFSPYSDLCTHPRYMLCLLQIELYPLSSVCASCAL